MTTVCELRLLAEEVEKLGGPSRELDARIEEMLLPGRRADPVIKGRMLRDPGDGRWVPCTLDARPYTCSLDAAAGLMPTDWEVRSEGPFGGNGWTTRARRVGAPPFLLAQGFGRTEAISRSAAALLARAELLLNDLPIDRP